VAPDGDPLTLNVTTPVKPGPHREGVGLLGSEIGTQRFDLPAPLGPINAHTPDEIERNTIHHSNVFELLAEIFGRNHSPKFTSLFSCWVSLT
jgi:hypothetical protein